MMKQNCPDLKTMGGKWGKQVVIQYMPKQNCPKCKRGQQMQGFTIYMELDGCMVGG